MGEPTITATCSFPGEPETAISISIAGKISEAVGELKQQTMAAVNQRLADAGPAEDVDLMEEVVEEEEGGGSGAQRAACKKRKKGAKG